MFEGIVASLLNRYLGKYVEDLDLESLNVGIFSGNVVLEGLKLRPEALYELGLPIYVKLGTIGRLTLSIPWNRLCNQTSIITVEEVFILTAPVTAGKYKSDIEKRLLRAEKRRILNELDPAGSMLLSESPENFAETLITSILNSLRVYIHSVHIRYEDNVTNSNIPVAVGLCMHSLSVENTNSKWKPISHSSKMGSIYQVMKIESFSLYCNANCSELLIDNEVISSTVNNTWLHCMKRSLETFSMNGEAFDFVLKPISARLKMIINKSNETRILKLLVDFVLQDAALQLSHQQYLALVQLTKSFHRISLNRVHRKFKPEVPVRRNARLWWRYAYDSIIQSHYQPYTWSHLYNHRKNYRNYCSLYEKRLLDPGNTEIKIDLQRIEDTLDIYNVIIAQEETKMKMQEKYPEKIVLKEIRLRYWFWFPVDSDLKRLRLCINDRKNGFWNQLSTNEKSSLYEMIGYTHCEHTDLDKSKHYIEHKVNVTIANFNLSLVSGGSETLVIGISHLLSSVEMRPAAKAYKISTRIESLVIEGASVEYSLIPIITSANILNGNSNTNFLVFDFEKNPSSNEVDYSLSIQLEPLEIIYHEFSVSSFSSFLQTPTFSLESTMGAIVLKVKSLINKIASNSVSRRCIFQINVDMKLPHLAVPEYGSLQSNGNILIFDLGRLKIWSDLQLGGLCLEDATQLELEEKLYDRFYFSLTEFQILMFNHDQDWRQFKNVHSSQYHILSKIHSQVVFSNNIKLENKQLPRNKLNVSLQKLKLNMSDSRIIQLLNFLKNLPRPKSYTVLDIDDDVILMESIHSLEQLHQLEMIQLSLISTKVVRQIEKSPRSKDKKRLSYLDVDRATTSSDISDEDSELWAQILDLPGFDDNVSQNNVIVYLFRINIAQVILELKRSCNNIDKPYLLFQATNFCLDIAIMEYGPAIQISLESLNLVDKLHSSISSNQMKLLSTEGKPDVLTVLYRKVRSDCPDFKSHFRSVEQSLVVDVNTLQLTMHREACVHLYRYLQYCSRKFDNYYMSKVSKYVKTSAKSAYDIWFKMNDPPIPPGSTKFSYSVRILHMKLQLCDTEIDFLLAKMSGFELDCLFKANDRLVFRSFLHSLTIDDISNTSLYPKIFSVEEEKLLEIKYMRHTRKAGKSNIDSNSSDIKSDGSFKFYVGRIHLVLMAKFIYDVKKFFTPFVSTEVVSHVCHVCERGCLRLISCLRYCPDKINLSIYCQLPTLLLPQQASLPNLIVFNTGDLIAENFFKGMFTDDECQSKTSPLIDNILIQLDGVSVARAIVSLNGSIIVQETIVVPLCCKMEIKRSLINHHLLDELDSTTFDISLNIDKVIINLGQKDFSTLYFTWIDNIKKSVNYCYVQKGLHRVSDEAKVRKLQAFFYQSERNRREFVVRTSFDGLILQLYSDIEEMLSSPVRDENRSVCKFEVGEVVFNGQYYVNGKTENQMSIQSLLLEDTRVLCNVDIRKIFQSYGATNTRSNNENVCITVPPVLSVTLNRNQNGESRYDVLIDHTRLNLGMSFVTDLCRFFIEAIPYEQEVSCTNVAGFVNYGYMNESIGVRNEAMADSEDQQDRRFSEMYLEETAGLSLSVTCRKPEIMFFSTIDDYSKSHALLLRSDLSFEYIRHPSNVSFICHINDLHLLSKLQSKLVNTSSSVVLQPCNLEISKHWASLNNETKISITCDKIDLHVSASTVHTIVNIIQELDTSFSAEPPSKKYDSCDNFYQDLDDLWTPKKIPPYYLPQKRESILEQGNPRTQPESMIVSLPFISLMLEIEDIVQKKPVLLLKMRTEAKLKNWSTSLEMKGDVNLQCSYYNYTVNEWEPVIEPLVKTDNVYRPWEMTVKVFKSKSYPMSTILGCGKNDGNSQARKKSSTCSTKISVKSSLESETSADEDESALVSQKIRKPSLLVPAKDQFHMNYSDSGSESDNEDTVMEKLKSKFGQLLTGESSDENVDSDSDISMDDQSVNENSEGSDNDSVSFATKNSFLLDKRAVFITKQRESADSGLDSENYDKSASYVIFEAQDRLEVVITPNTISVVKQIFDSFSLKFNNILSDTQFLSLRNDITPHSTVTLRTKTTLGAMRILMCANYSLDDSSPSSRNSTNGTPCNFDNASDSEFNSGIETFEGGFAPDAFSKTDNAKRKSDNDLVVNALQFPQISVDILYSKVMDRHLHIRVPGFEDLTIICPMRTINKHHALQPIKNKIRYHIVVSVQNDLWGQVILIRSPLQIKNETCYALGLYYKKNALDNSGFEHIGELMNPFEDVYKFATVEPDEEYNVPIVVTYHCSIYVLPVYEDYQLSDIGLWWKELASNMSSPQDIVCKSKDGKSPVFVTRAVTNTGVQLSNMNSSPLPNFRIRLLPSVVLYNLLPCAFTIEIPSANFKIRIEAGGKSSIYSLDMNTRHTVYIEVPIYFGITWTGNFSLYNKLEEKSITMTTDQDTDGGNKHLSLSIKLDKCESQNVMIYAPYWIVNKTGLPLQLKGSASDVIYETFVEEPLYFTFRKSQKKTIRLRIYQSSWSSAFSIDTIACSGLIICRDRERNRSYHILIEISVSQLNPCSTKIVTLLPYFLLSNQCRMPIRYMEENEHADLWIDLPLNQAVPFWPETNSMKMYVKYKDSSVVSQHFYFNQTCQTVLRMDRGTALVADIEGGENKPFLIVIRNYKSGDAPVRIDNFCDDLFLKISQEGLGQVTLLSPYQSLLYTWDDPINDRKLQWNVYNRKSKGFTVNFKMDGYGQEFVSFKLIKKQMLSCSTSRTSKLSSSLKKLTAKYSNDSSNSGEESDKGSGDAGQNMKTHKGKVIVFWVSYLEGTQRVLLFTQDEQVAFYAYSRIDSERSNVELFFSMKGLGVSLVNDYNNSRRELAYVSATDSATIWEVNIAHSWKILPLELATWIEHQWSQGIKRAQLKDYVSVDLEKMHLIKPFFGELKRSYYPALWLHGRKSFNYYYLQWKIHHFQIDNQLPNSTFETILYPKMVSYNIIRKYGLKPCFEGTILKKKDTDYEKDVYKYVKLTMLELSLQVDKQFLLSIYDLLQPWLRPQSASLRIRADICKVHHPLTIKFNNRYDYERKTVIEYLYFSPMKVQLIFLPHNVVTLNNNIYDQTYLKSCLYFILHYTSANYMDNKEIKLKCPYFEESGIMTNMSTKLKQIRRYYFQNLLQQIYSYLLKIDTPSRISSDIDLCDEYVELYYDLTEEQFKKIDEFADAISDSARYLLSHVISSSANAGTSLIMCGKRTSLDLGLNPEIIKKKSITQRMSFDEPEEVLKGNHCFEIGVIHGLSGVHVNPGSGSHQNGTELFFKTIGKHLLRLLNKYSSTIYNMPLAAIDGMRRAAETGIDIIYRKRLPKYINPFGMRPYSVHHAIGLNIVNSVCKGVYAETDDYWTHVVLTHDGKSCLLLTLQRIFLITKNCVWDEWKVQWCLMVNDIIEVPQVVDNKLIFKSRQEETGNEGKSIEHQDVHVLFWIQKMIEIVFIINLENKPYSFVESQASKLN